MSTALLTRSVVVAGYLLGLLIHGGVNLRAGLLALAIVAVWAAPLLRDRFIRRADQTRMNDSYGVGPLA
jgi:hypothetical protein